MRGCAHCTQSSRVVDNLAKRCNVALVGDDLCNLLGCLLGYIPGVALGIDGVFGVVVEVVDYSAVAIVHKYVLSGVIVVGCRVIGLSEVHVAAANHGHTPEAALHVVSGGTHLLLHIRVVEAHAATTVHCVGLIAVVYECVVLECHVHRTYRGEAIAAVLHVVPGDFSNVGSR